MKKSLLALAALTAFAGVASAQSSVTLFGIVDLNARSTKVGSATVKSLSTDGIASSRLGFRGVEDLGGGLRAGFWLEAGLAADTGNLGGGVGCTTKLKTDGTANTGYKGFECPSNGSANVFNRRATASLMGGFGEVRLGRDYTPSFWNYTVFDPFGTNGVAAMTNIVDSSLGSPAITFVRDNNTIGYFLPAMGGLYGQVQVAAGELAAGQKYMGGRIGYAAGPVNVAVAMGKTKKTTGGSVSMVDDFSDTNVGASWNMGFMNLMGQYSKRDYGTADQKTWLIGARVPFGASTLKASFGKSDGNTDARDHKLLGLGYQYDLSKRTALYATYAKRDSKVNATDMTAYEFGVMHAF